MGGEVAAADQSVDSERMLGNEDFQLIELAKKVLFQLGNETRAAPTAEVQHGHNDDPIKVGPAVPPCQIPCKGKSRCNEVKPWNRCNSRSCRRWKTSSAIGRPALSLSGK